jgi:hypothetical protein
MAGRVVPWRENRLAAWMTWPQRTVSRYRLAPPGSANRRYLTSDRDPPAVPIQAR